MKRGRIFIFLLSVSTIVLLLYQHNHAFPSFAPQRIPDVTLIIDPGHGGEDGGAVSPGGTVESHINLQISLRLAALLDIYGIPYNLLRDSDRSLHSDSCKTLREKKVSDLRNRVSAIESTPNAIVMSIHQNIFSNSRYHGAHVFFSAHPESLSFAQTVQSTLKQALDPENNRIPAQIPDSVYLMKHITCPAVLVECGFLSNPEEEALLKTVEHQTKLAITLVSSYIQYQDTAKEELTYESS